MSFATSHRRLLAASCIAGLAGALPGSAWAQTAPAAAPAAPATPATPSASAATTAPAALPDPVLATVNGQPIRSTDLALAARTLPPQLRQMPPQMLQPLILDQLIDLKATADQARKLGLEKQPEVQHALANADDRVLQTALLQKDVLPQLSEDAIKAKYEAEDAGKPGPKEVKASHILVPTEAEAVKLIAQLKKGADFAALAKKYSKDPGAAKGGELGYFKQGDMVKPFSDAAFAMKPGQISDKPVKTDFGWHIIKVEAVRQAPPPTLEQAHDKIRQELIQAAVTKVVKDARAGVTVVRYNPDGSVQTPSTEPNATAPAPGSPPPAPAAAAPVKK